MSEDGAPAWAGGAFGARGRCVLAPNANHMTLDGTNTWVLTEPGAGRCVVVDPGPEITEHLDAVVRVAEEVAGGVGAVLLTHGHLDHAEAARTFAERVGCGVRALDPTHRLGEEGLGDGDVVELDGLELRVVGTPGHTADSLSFVLPAEQAVLTGDTVLGRGTTVVAHPDGRLGAYLDSLGTLRDLAEAAEVRTIWPGHGPVLHDALAVIDGYQRHREQRLSRVREAAQEADLLGPLRAHPSTEVPDDAVQRVVETVYADVDPQLWPAASLSVRAQLEYLARG